MKICTKCKRQALITHEDKDLCVRHFNLLPDKEDKPTNNLDHRVTPVSNFRRYCFLSSLNSIKGTF